MKIFKKILKIFGIALAVVLLAIGYFYLRFRQTPSPVWGINFSISQAKYLGLNPEEVFQRMLIELKPKKIRLMAYWEDLEPSPGAYDFSAVDSLLNQSAVAGAEVTLVVGHKQPRWPECHHPAWYNGLNADAQKKAILSIVEKSVEHFRSFSAIERWQVENEPFFNYGPDCPISTPDELKDEIAEVKKLDSRPVIVTDSGEKGGWLAAASQADIFGTTMYRTIYHSRFKRYITYPLPPSWYPVRAGIAESFTNIRGVIDVELQAEPWFQSDFYSASLDQQLQLMSLDRFNGNISYAQATGLPEHYLWGVEWWYWMRDHDHPEYWERIQQLLNP